MTLPEMLSRCAWMLPMHRKMMDSSVKMRWFIRLVVGLFPYFDENRR
jgi:hypothetical protein